jgi:malate dehydrogenase
MPRSRIGVIGAGMVGSSLAQCLVMRDLGDVVLSDIVEGMPQGKALDLCQSRGPNAHDSAVRGTNSLDDMNGCEVVVVTAGVPRKPGMTREQLLDINARIIRDVAAKARGFQPQPILIVVTNPLDVMTFLAYRETGFPKRRVIGMAGALDSARFVHFIAERLQVSVKDVSAMVLGSHGDTMVPLPRFTTVSGVPLTELLPAEEIEKLVRRTRDGGAEIVALLKTGSAYYAPAAAIASMVESILKDEKRVLPCACYLEGEYGLRDVFVGVPAKLGREGVEQIVELNLSESERAALHASAKVVRENAAILKIV